MRSRHLRLIPLLALALAGPAIADHEGPGSLTTLLVEVHNLKQIVDYSPLRYAVKQAVVRFMLDAEGIDRCIDGVGFPHDSADDSVADDHVTDDHQGGVPDRCRYQLDVARSSFHPVERYLYDTSFDFPQVYQAYLRTRAALYALF